MIYYTKLDNQKYGLLIFKVIGAQSRQEAERITADNWGEALMRGRILEGPPTICPLFEDLGTIPPQLGRPESLGLNLPCHLTK